MDTGDSPVEKVFQQKGLCPPTLGITFSGTQCHSLPVSRFRCKQLFGPAREWPSREQAMEAGRAWRRASRGGTKAALNLNPITVPASSSPPPNITGTRPDGKRRRQDNDFDLVLPVRISQDCQPPCPHPSTAAGSEFSLLPLGRGIRRGPGPRRTGPFSLCTSEAKSLAVLPTRLGWVTANLCRPSASGRMRYLLTWRRPPRGAVPCFRTERREAWLQLGGAMFPYGEAGGRLLALRSAAQWAVARRLEVPAPRRAVSCFRSERWAPTRGPRLWALVPEQAAGEEREVEEVRRQASEGKGRSPIRNLVHSLTRPGFQI